MDISRPRRALHGAAALAVTVLAIGVGSCEDEDTTAPPPPPTNPVVLANHSATPLLVKNLPAGVTAYTLLGSDDVFPNSPAFVYGGSADGAGLLKNSDGTFTFVTNHEDNFSVSRITLDSTFKPVRGEYIMNSTFGRWRLCSATMATIAEHGFGPLFLTVGESNIESQIHGVNPYGPPNSSTILNALGHWNSENAVPLPTTAYPGKTIIMIGDDDSGTNGGQVVMYRSDIVGDLAGGKLYVLARADNGLRERDIVVGTPVNVVFREIGVAGTQTGAQLEAVGLTLSMLPFGRVEDIDYRKGGGANGREIYFTVTGQNNTGVNAAYDRTKYGRVYRLTLDAANPLIGTLSVVLDGDDRAGPAGAFQNPDNIVVGTNYVYVQEDGNLYGDETHDSRIYQYNIATSAVTVVAELDHRRTAADAAKFNVGGTSVFGSWEFGAMIDISAQTGLADTWLINIQPHTWTGARYQNPDGGTLRPAEQQTSQTIVVRGLPR